MVQSQILSLFLCHYLSTYLDFFQPVNTLSEKTQLGVQTLSRNRATKAHNKRMTQVEENTISFSQAPKAQPRRIDLIPRTRNQERLVMALLDPAQHIVVTTGPAGTGKTYLAMQAAVKALREGTCDRIVMTRPAVGVEGCLLYTSPSPRD